MKKLSIAIACCILLLSCNTFKIAADKKATVKDLGVEWSYAQKVNPVYYELIDSAMAAFIIEFNSGNHAFNIHKKVATDVSYVSLSFDKGKFRSKGGVAAGYIVTAIGMIVTPIVLLELSDSRAFALFWYFPSDQINISGNLSPNLSAKPGKRMQTYVSVGAMFSSRPKRIQKMNKKLKKEMQRLFMDMDKQVSKAK